MLKRAGFRLIAALCVIGIQPTAVLAQAAPGTKIERLDGVWIEGPGYEITYGGNYDGCAARCLAAPKCAMIEYYRPEKKCNLYDAVRPRKTGGSSNVGIRK
jgi:PAN domain